MKSFLKYFGVFMLGALLVYFLMKQFQSSKQVENAHVIAYELKKLSKLITAEQNFSEIYKHESSNYIPGFERYLSFDKKVVLLVNARLQASYNMQKMDIELDSVNRIIKLKKIPDINIEVFPDVKFFDLDQSTFNTFEKDELNEIKERAVEHIHKKIDQEKIKKEAHQKLIENLHELYVVAKLYGWTIENKTPYAKEAEMGNFN